MAENEKMVNSSFVRGENLHSIRKSKKPLMEKRRRARINECLTQLKDLILQAIKKDSSQFSKLEKADILEMAVKHVQLLHSQQAAAQAMEGVGKFRAGFHECATLINHYMVSERRVDHQVKEHLMNHLSACLQAVGARSAETLQQQFPLMPVHAPARVPPSHPLSSGGGGAPAVLLSSQNAHFHPGLGFTAPSMPAPAPDGLVSLPPLPGLSIPGLSPTSAVAASAVLSRDHPADVPGAFQVMAPGPGCAPPGAVGLHGAGSPVTTTTTVTTTAASPSFCVDTTNDIALPLVGAHAHAHAHAHLHPSQYVSLIPSGLPRMPSAHHSTSTSPSVLDMEDLEDEEDAEDVEEMAQASFAVDPRQTSWTEDADSSSSPAAEEREGDSPPSSSHIDISSVSAEMSGNRDSNSPSASNKRDCDISSPSTSNTRDSDVNGLSAPSTRNSDVNDPSAPSTRDSDVNGSSTSNARDSDVNGTSTSSIRDSDVSGSSTSSIRESNVESSAAASSRDDDISSLSTSNPRHSDIRSSSTEASHSYSLPLGCNYSVADEKLWRPW